MVLAFRSEYPDSFPQEFVIEYLISSKMLIVDYQLPRPQDLPTIREIKYTARQDKFEKLYLSDIAGKKQYDHVLHQICLRSLHELFSADVIQTIDSISFNGYVRSVDPSTWP